MRTHAHWKEEKTFGFRDFSWYIEVSDATEFIARIEGHVSSDNRTLRFCGLFRDWDYDFNQILQLTHRYMSWVD